MVFFPRLDKAWNFQMGDGESGKPALVCEPQPVAASSRISPPEPVAAPGWGKWRWDDCGLHLHQDMGVFLVVAIFQGSMITQKNPGHRPLYDAALSL